MKPCLLYETALGGLFRRARRLRGRRFSERLAQHAPLTFAESGELLTHERGAAGALHGCDLVDVGRSKRELASPAGTSSPPPPRSSACGQRAAPPPSPAGPVPHAAGARSPPPELGRQAREPRPVCALRTRRTRR